jgi:hypothetical protein
MIEDSQNLNNIENKEEVVNKPPKSQKKLVIILLGFVIILLGTVIYFLIKDEIIQIPFLETEQDTLENINEEGLIYEEKEFYIPSKQVDTTNYYFLTNLPVNTVVDNSNDNYTEIDFNNSKLRLSIPDISIPETVKSFEDIDDGKLLTLYRVIDDSNNIYYTSNLRTTEDCVEVGASAPCGSLTVELPDNDNNIIYIQIQFIGKEEDLEIADNIVENLSFQKSIKVNEGTTSDEVNETEDIDTSNWVTYELDNPKLSFKYPNGHTVSLVPTNDDQFVHLQISGARESFNYYMSYGEGGPGVGTSGEIEPPESITMMGEFLGGEVYEIKNGEFYKYFSYIEKCSICLSEEGYSPGCPCTSADNYTYNSMFNRNLRWDSVGIKETFIEIEVKWTMSDYYRNIYENILLSFEEI